MGDGQVNIFDRFFSWIKSHPRLILALGSMLIYAPTMFFAWVYYDDYLIASDFHFYSNLSNGIAVFYQTLWEGSSVPFSYYRPISMLVFILNSWFSALVAGSAVPAVFHFTNVILHAVSVVLLYEFLYLIGTVRNLAFATSVFFSILPICINTVAWIPGQNELLLAIFVLGSLVIFLKTEQPLRFWMITAQGCFFLSAFLTKENAIALPLISFLCFYLVPSKRTSSRTIGLFGALWVLLTAFWFWIRSIVITNSASTISWFDAINSIWSGLNFLPIYIGKVFFPYRLSVLSTYHDSSLWPGYILVFFVGIGLAISKSKRWNRVLFGLIWFLAFLLPTFIRANPESDSFILREDRVYLASIGLWILILEIDFFKNFSFKSTSKFAGMVVVWIGLVFLNLIYSRSFADGMSFYAAGVENSPHLALAHTHLGDMLMADKRFDEAGAAYQKALKLNPFETRLHNNLGVLYLRQGKLNEAEKQFKAEIELLPTDPLAWDNLGFVYFIEGDNEKAEATWLQIVNDHRDYVNSWINLARLYEKIHQTDKLQKVIVTLQSLGINYRLQ